MFLLIHSDPAYRQISHLSLHSTMFLLIRKRAGWSKNPVYTFTFHYVSINTIYHTKFTGCPAHFTFHYVSINTASYTDNSGDQRTLHSTMFLLIHRSARWSCTANDFTFHYVSINTAGGDNRNGESKSLHSTMFLLIPLSDLETIPSPDLFTFHYVSINTLYIPGTARKEITLHSTMFLLIHCMEQTRRTSKKSLHSTMFLLIQRRKKVEKMFCSSLHSTMFLLIRFVGSIGHCSNILYIPLCFY